MDVKSFLDTAKGLVGAKGSEIELPAPQGLFDRFINAVNRLGRPLLLIGVVAFFMWGISNPIHFVTVMGAFAKTPEWISTSIILVITIFGSGRIINDVKKRQTMKVQTGEQDAEPEAEAEETPVSDRTFDNLKSEGEDVDDLPPENSAIDEWKSNAAS